jgi:hypothetical protein
LAKPALVQRMIEGRNATTSGTLFGLSKSAGGSPVLSKDELDRVINRVTSSWVRPKGLDAGRFKAVDTPADLPVAILCAASEQNIPHDEIKGALNEGHIHLVR